MQHTQINRWPSDYALVARGSVDCGPGLLVSRAFWLAGLASLAAWVGIGSLFAWLF